MLLRQSRRILLNRPIGFGFSTTLDFQGNSNAFPKFKSKDNSTGVYDAAKHSIEKWDHKDVSSAIAGLSQDFTRARF